MPNPRIDTCEVCGARNHRGWHPDVCRECGEQLPWSEFVTASELRRAA